MHGRRGLKGANWRRLPPRLRIEGLDKLHGGAQPKETANSTTTSARGQADISWESTLFIQSNWNDLDHMQVQFRIALQDHIYPRDIPFAPDAWTREQHFAQAPRLSMRREWDEMQYATLLDNYMQETPTEA